MLKNLGVLCLALAIALSPAYAKGGGGFSGGRSFSSGSSFSGSRSFSGSSSFSSGRSSSGFSGSSSKSVSAPTRSTTSDAIISRKASSDSYSSFRASSAPPRPARSYTYSQTYSSPAQLHTYRQTIYVSRYHWTPAPYYTGGFYAPHYGVYDTMFLWLMLDTNRSWMYSNQNDPGYQQWRQDAEKQAATNAELRAKLTALDAEMVKMKQDGTQQTPGTLPTDVPPEVAMADENVIPAAVPEAAPDEESHWGWWVAGGIVVILVGIVVFA